MGPQLYKQAHVLPILAVWGWAPLNESPGANNVWLAKGLHRQAHRVIQTPLKKLNWDLR